MCIFGRPEALYAAVNKKPTSAACTVGEGELLAIYKLDGSQISYWLPTVVTLLTSVSSVLKWG